MSKPGDASRLAPHDPTSIPDDDRVLRRLSDDRPSMVYVDPLTNQRRPSSGSFAVKKDEDGLSVYREQVLSQNGLTAAAVVTSPTNLVVALEVHDIRSIRPLNVRDDPWPTDIPDTTHPRNAAHALITGWQGLSRSERKERQNALVNAPSLRFVYP